MMPYLISLSFAAVGVLYMGIAVPMIRGRVKRNPWYGFRTPKTLSSDAIWYPANAYSGRAMFAAGAVITAGSLVTLPFAGLLGVSNVATIGLVLLIATMLVTLWKSFSFLRGL